MKLLWTALLASTAILAGCSEPTDQADAGDPHDQMEVADTETDVSAETEEAETADASADPADFEVTNYAEMENWLCHPDKANDACDVDLSYTIVNADGTTTAETFEAAENPPIDCFYIYPTVSMDETANSDLEANDEELRVAEGQLARFAETCRIYAPMYRQITVPELRRAMTGQGFTANMDMRWSDVTGAWNDYVENENDGRGVVILGHSQGSSLVQELVKKEIVGSEMEDKIVSVMPIGITTYADADTGNFGPFEPCAEASQTGCIIAYSSYRSTNPPPPTALFGKSGPAGNRAMCVNPAELTGDDGVLDARLSSKGWFGGADAEFANGEGVDTPFAAVPGLLTAKCVETDGYTYLEMTVNGDPADPRVDDIDGDVPGPTGPNRDWGLHLIDMHAAMGNLVEIVSAQADTWVAEHPSDTQE
ncbi:DUF3089 domain-containing protein [Henriciella litoralis]|uniref:DUF3089 domain-containing protein n=1 Tax=Henriciella litoralis TaxID=568102 RepID=UPI000A018CDC|nr:DUF3089 domain-containing protein [Henriciella litoralis]